VAAPSRSKCRTRARQNLRNLKSFRSLAEEVAFRNNSVSHFETPDGYPFSGVEALMLRVGTNPRAFRHDANATIGTSQMSRLP